MLEKNTQLTFIMILLTVFGVSTGIWYLYTKGIDVGKLQPALPIKKDALEAQFPGNLTLQSPAFKNAQEIPIEYTCKGKNVNPPLEILNVPENTKSLLLVVDDPDAPLKTFDHWLVFNISPNTKGIATDTIPTGALQGQNSVGKGGYEGPCPPTGKHTYRFKLYALDSVLELSTGATKDNISAAVAGHILDKAELKGIFGN